MSDNVHEANGDDDLKRKLVRRVAFAGILIALLLGTLAFIDHLGQPSDEPLVSGPTFTSPVPVPRKEVSQPVKPAEPAVAEAAKEAAAPAPVAEAPTASPAVSQQAADLPARPEVAAQPALPRQDARGAVIQPAPRSARAGAATPTPAEGTSAASSQFMPEPEKSVPQQTEPRAQAVERAQPAPPRLFSGYAVQAGVFSDAERAEELRAKLTLNGIPSTMEARVQVGPFKTREEAEAARQKLKALGIEGLLLPPRGARR